MKILYLSNLASPAAIDDANRRDKSFRGYAIQKFGRLLTEGLVDNNCEVTALSTFYLPNVGHGYRRKKEHYKGVTFNYISSPNNRPLRYIWLILSCFFYVLLFGLTQRKRKAIICDVLNVSACIGALLAVKLTGTRCIGLVTDMPGLLVTEHHNRGKMSLAARINRLYLSKFSHYIFLTEEANRVLNINKRPYIVMEGIVDVSMESTIKKQEGGKRIVLYAGGLMERYGLKMLVEGFLKADVRDSELWIYGDGDFSKQLFEYEKKDTRIHYFGICPNEMIVKAEQDAVLLVNPRPTHEEFTKYSFPSKNLEYMVSGTAVLTTRLPGMPQEYYPYVFLFDEESIDGYASTLQRILSLPLEELNRKGQESRSWVLEYKNNVRQTGRILLLLEK